MSKSHFGQWLLLVWLNVRDGKRKAFWFREKSVSSAALQPQPQPQPPGTAAQHMREFPRLHDADTMLDL